MATYDADTLRSMRDAAVTRLNEALASPKMDYQVDGQMFNWTQYQRMLTEQIKFLTEQLRDMGEDDGGFGYETGVART